MVQTDITMPSYGKMTAALIAVIITWVDGGLDFEWPYLHEFSYLRHGSNMFGKFTTNAI